MLRKNKQPLHPALPQQIMASEKKRWKKVFSDHVPIYSTIPFPENKGGELNGINMISWNVLHHDNDNALALGNATKCIESPAQEEFRHSKIAESLANMVKNQETHLITLQEVGHSGDPVLLNKIIESLNNIKGTDKGTWVMAPNEDHSSITLYNEKYFDSAKKIPQPQVGQPSVLGMNVNELILKNSKKSIMVCNCHGTYSPTPRLHNNEIRAVLSQGSADKKVIVAGDFNTPCLTLNREKGNVATAATPSKFSPEGIQGGNPLDASFYSSTKDNKVGLHQAETVQLNPVTGKPYAPRELLKPLEKYEKDANNKIDAEKMRAAINIGNEYNNPITINGMSPANYEMNLRKSLPFDSVILLPEGTDITQPVKNSLADVAYLVKQNGQILVGVASAMGKLSFKPLNITETPSLPSSLQFPEKQSPVEIKMGDHPDLFELIKKQKPLWEQPWYVCEATNLNNERGIGMQVPYKVYAYLENNPSTGFEFANYTLANREVYIVSCKQEYIPQLSAAMEQCIQSINQELNMTLHPPVARTIQSAVTMPPLPAVPTVKPDLIGAIQKNLRQATDILYDEVNPPNLMAIEATTGNTALHYAVQMLQGEKTFNAEGTQYEYQHASLYREIVRTLINSESGAALLNVKNADGQTPKDMLQDLLQHLPQGVTIQYYGDVTLNEIIGEKLPPSSHVVSSAAKINNFNSDDKKSVSDLSSSVQNDLPEVGKKLEEEKIARINEEKLEKEKVWQNAIAQATAGQQIERIIGAITIARNEYNRIHPLTGKHTKKFNNLIADIKEKAKGEDKIIQLEAIKSALETEYFSELTKRPGSMTRMKSEHSNTIQKLNDNPGKHHFTRVVCLALHDTYPILSSDKDRFSNSDFLYLETPTNNKKMYVGFMAKPINEYEKVPVSSTMQAQPFVTQTSPTPSQMPPTIAEALTVQKPTQEPAKPITQSHVASTPSITSAQLHSQEKHKHGHGTKDLLKSFANAVNPKDFIEKIKHEIQSIKPVQFSEPVKKASAPSKNKAPTLPEYDYLFKFNVYGSESADVRNLISRFTDNTYKQNELTGFRPDFCIKNLKIDNQNIKLQIWDRGDRPNKDINSQFERGIHGAIIAIDLTDKNALMLAENKLETIISNGHAIDSTHIIIVGTNSEDEEKSLFKPHQLEKFVSDMGEKYARKIEFTECSPKTGAGVKEVFEKLATKTVRGLDDEQPVNTDKDKGTNRPHM